MKKISGVSIRFLLSTLPDDPNWISYVIFQMAPPTGQAVEKPAGTRSGSQIWYSSGSVSKPCTPSVHIKIAGIYGCSSPSKWYFHRYWSIPIWSSWWTQLFAAQTIWHVFRPRESWRFLLPCPQREGWCHVHHWALWNGRLDIFRASSQLKDDLQ